MADGMADFKPASVDHECPIFIYFSVANFGGINFCFDRTPIERALRESVSQNGGNLLRQGRG